MRGDRGGLLADLVGAVGCGAGCLLHGLGSGLADHDLHAVVLVRVAGRVLEAPLVHDAGRGGDVLVDVLASLGCGDLAPHVARVGRIRGVVAALHLDGVGTGGVVVGSPAELAGIPVVELAVQRVADDAGLRADYGEVGCVVTAVDPLVLVDDLVAAIIERAVHQMVRQIRRIIRHRLHVSGSLRFGGLDGVLLATLIRRDLAGRVGCVLIVCELVRLAETDVIQQIAVPRAVSLDAMEGETRDGAGGDVRAGVRLPLARMRSLLELIAVGYLRVADLGADDRADLAELVSMPVRGGAGGFLRGLLARFADDDAHLVQVAGVETGVFEAPLVHDSRNGGDILVDGSAGLGGVDLAVMVGSVGLIVDLHVVGAFEVRIGGIAGLRAVPGEFRLVEALGQLVSLFEHRPLCEV